MRSSRDRTPKIAVLSDDKETQTDLVEIARITLMHQNHGVRGELGRRYGSVLIQLELTIRIQTNRLRGSPKCPFRRAQVFSGWQGRREVAQ